MPRIRRERIPEALMAHLVRSSGGRMVQTLSWDDCLRRRFAG